MKKLKSVFALLLAVTMLTTILPMGIINAYGVEFVNADSENYVDGYVYAVDDDGRVFKALSDDLDKTYLTDYPADRVAVYDDFVYASAENAIHKIGPENGTDTVMLTFDTAIDRFTITDSGIYVLTSGQVLFADGNGYSPAVEAEGVTSFWLDEGNKLSYITDGESIYTLSLATGEETGRPNYVDEFGEEIPIMQPSYGNKRLLQASSITNLKEKFPAGKYWNHVGSGSNNPNGYTSTPCGHHGGCDYLGSCGCNSFSSAIQCMGYAFKCGYDVYGTDPRNWTKYTTTSAVDNVKPGDVIRYRNDGHSIFVIGVSGDTIIYTDCNWGGNCNIRWNATISKSTLKASFTNLRSAPYSAPGAVNTTDSGSTVYTVSFNANGGTSSTSSFKIYAGNEYGDLPTAYKEGYNLEGWYTQASGGTKVTENTICNSSTTLYAHWVIATYIIRYDENGGTGAPDMQSKKYGATLTLSTTVPRRSGFTFKGWNTAIDGTGTNYSAGGPYTANADATLYAMWGGSHEVTLKANGGTVAPSRVSVSPGYAYGPLPTPVLEGYEFAGWYLETSLRTQVTSETIVASTSNHNLYAKWTDKYYTIKYNANGGTGAPDASLKKHGTTITLSTVTPTRTGYKFTGWYLTTDCTGTKYSAGGSYSANESITLYACWTPQQYIVAYNANGGSNAPASQVKDYNSTLTLTTDVPTKAGYDCVGWNTQANGLGVTYALGGEYSLNADITLYAVWDTAKYIITYDSNGGSGEPGYQSKLHGSSVTLKTSTVPTRTGYTFTGWLGSDGVTYTSDAVYSADSNLTLTAQWETIKYSVTYNANGGVGTVDSQQKEYDIALVLKSQGYTRTGYTLSSWNTKADGTGTTYKLGSTYTANAPLTLYAMWKANSYTVTFNPNYSGGSTTTRSYTYDSTYNSFPAVGRTGYTFTGWYTAQNGGTKINTTDKVTITSATTYYAHWSANTYTVTFDTGVDGENTTKDVTYHSGYGTLPTPERSGYVFAGWFTQKGGIAQVKANTTVTTASDHTLYAAWVEEVTPAQGKSVAYFISEGKLITAVEYTDGDTSITEPAVPERTGYKYTWDSYSLKNGGTTVFATRTPVTYYATFLAEGKVVEKVAYTIEYSAINEPAVPSKTGHTGKWEDYVLTTENITVNAVYTPNTYTVTFKADGKVIDTVSYVYGAAEITEPAVPQKAGYTAKWSGYSLLASDSTVEAIYTLITYYATFVAEGKTIAVVPFTITTKRLSEPTVPTDGTRYAFWEKYELGAYDITINAIYMEKPEINIRNYVTSRNESYRTTITFASDVKNGGKGSVHWFIDGIDKGTGNGDGTYTVKEAKSDFSIQAKIYEDGVYTAYSKTEVVRINTGFFAKIIAFFKGLFGMLPVVEQ